MRAEIWAPVGEWGIFYPRRPISVVIEKLLVKKMRALRGVVVVIWGAVGVLVSGIPISTGNYTRNAVEKHVNEVVVDLAYEKESWRDAIEGCRGHNTHGIVIDLSHCGLGSDGLESLSCQVVDNMMDAVLQSADATNYPPILHVALIFYVHN